MKHYSKEELASYKAGTLSEKDSDILEEHLTKCDMCCEMFLSMIHNEEIRQAQSKISLDFPTKVLCQVKKQRKVEPMYKKKAESPEKRNLFMYYIAASIVTFMLMNFGMFDKIANIVPVANATSYRAECSMNIDFPEKIVSGAHEWIQNFEEYK
ncbi:MAG TPA: hypothetical protein GXX43_08985 [Tepidanaerobacter syntrophicus]|uniref:hypothetical protein n=1 Tax=Tepidanaerobacter syntrophicus TaxID=224999 RepID=UPI0017732BCD|nr:hypothetical protein [Tepidanaerobacter syntrophicus]HHV83774.1 hypothetical protein [Tepidanaerobacter syntrophicus]